MMEIRDEKKKPYALFYMDLDFFKPVNDTYGHEMGDKVLKEVAKDFLNVSEAMIMLSALAVTNLCSS